MVYGREAVLPIEMKYPTWRTLGWNDVYTRGELIAARARQIEMRDEDIQEAMLRKTRRRQIGQEHFDATHQIRHTPLAVKDIVLRHDTFTTDVDKSAATKLSWRWHGPYKIRKADQLKGTYLLSELDGTKLAGTFPGNRLKKFVQRKKYFYSPDDVVGEESSDGGEGDYEEDGVEEAKEDKEDGEGEGEAA
jgi:hypothetical protein